jgi:hypothetical protein
MMDVAGIAGTIPARNGEAKLETLLAYAIDAASSNNFRTATGAIPALSTWGART